MKINSRITNPLVLVKHFNPSLELKIREIKGITHIEKKIEKIEIETRKPDIMLETSHHKLNMMNENLTRENNHFEI